VTPRQLLTDALAADPARALLTFYDDRTGERAELSVVTFENWVAKTANLLVDGLEARPGQEVALDLPVHWQAAVWLSACWATGLVVVPPGHPADIAVVRGDEAAPPVAGEVVALGLAPMGLARPDARLPSYVTLDYDREIHAHGDRFVPSAEDPEAPALRSGDALLTLTELGEATRAAVARWALPSGGRILCAAPYRGVDSVLAGLLVPLATRCGAVLTRHLDEVQTAARLGAENVVAASGVPSGLLEALPRVA
jgi:uncharacterized protein (TIGR03089 family)